MILLIMISMPMNDKDWKKKYTKVENMLKSKGHEVAPLYIRDLLETEPVFRHQVVNVPLLYMGNSFYRMSICDSIYFCAGWDKARGCQLEHKAAKAYGLKIIYEEEDKKSNGPYKCTECEYYRQCPKVDPITGKSPAFMPNSLSCIAIHKDPETGLKVANATMDELVDMLEERLKYP